MSKHYPDDDLDDLRCELRNNAAIVARELLGPENKAHSTAQQLRFGGNKGSMSVEVGPKNTGTWYEWAEDVGGDMFALIMHVNECGFVQAKRIAREILGLPAHAASSYAPRSRLIPVGEIGRNANAHQQGNSKTQRYGLDLWKQGIDSRGTLIEVYLESRKLAISDEIATNVIRYHPPFRYAGRTCGAMIALFRDIVTDKPAAVSVTFLNANAEKLDRRFFGPVGNAAIKLNVGTANTLNIGEGIESTLGGAMMDYTPAWAVGSAGAIANFPIIQGVKTLRIFGERNDGGANERAVRKLSKRWRNSVADIYVVDPGIGHDLNDIVRAGYQHHD
jgi:Toprim domain